MSAELPKTAAGRDGDAASSPAARLARAGLARAAPHAALGAWFGMVVILFYVAVALFAPLLAPYAETELVGGPFEPWGEPFLLGTDQLGRDMLSRLIYGARNTIGIAVLTTALAFLLGGMLGLMAAMLGGWIDQLLGRAVDVLMAIPQLIFALVLLSIVGPSLINLILIIAVLDSTRVFRLTRAVAMNVVVMDFVEAARLQGERLLVDHAPRDPAQHPAAAGGRVRPALLLRVPDHQRARLPRPRHPAADRRLGLDGARERDPDHLWRRHAAAAGGRDRAADRRGQFRRRLVPAQDERAAR